MKFIKYSIILCILLSQCFQAHSTKTSDEKELTIRPRLPASYHNVNPDCEAPVGQVHDNLTLKKFLSRVALERWASSRMASLRVRLTSEEKEMGWFLNDMHSQRI